MSRIPSVRLISLQFCFEAEDRVGQLKGQSAVARDVKTNLQEERDLDLPYFVECSREGTERLAWCVGDGQSRDDVCEEGERVKKDIQPTFDTFDAACSLEKSSERLTSKGSFLEVYETHLVCEDENTFRARGTRTTGTSLQPGLHPGLSSS
jgi:hypothetical protein